MRVWLVLACNTAAEKAFGPDPVSPFMPTVPSPTPGTEPTSHTSEPPTDAVESCDDGLDNDDDGASDCLDDDCVAPGCAELCPCDGDLDGYATSALGGSDCDDAVATVHPDATEFCDAIDNDCDALIDDDDSDTVDNIVVWFDGDGDGYGTEDQPLRVCALGPNQSSQIGDCADDNPLVFPDQAEVCVNGVDDDCDGFVNDEDSWIDETSLATWYLDADLDGVGAPEDPVTACDWPDTHHAPGDDDCDPNDPLVGAPSDWWLDADGDGFGTGALFGTVQCESPGLGWVQELGVADCDDGNAEIHPSRVDVCGDGVDEDCDGAVDDCTCTDLTVALLPGDPWGDLNNVITNQADYGLCAVTLANFNASFNLGLMDVRGSEAVVIAVPTSEFYPGAEAAAIEAFVQQRRGGLVVIYDVTGSELAWGPLLGVDVGQVDGTVGFVYPTLVPLLEDHALLAGLGPSFNPGGSYDALVPTTTWAEALLPGASLVAIDENDSVVVVAYDDGDRRSVWLTWGQHIGATTSGEQLVYNALVWASGYNP